MKRVVGERSLTLCPERRKEAVSDSLPGEKKGGLYAQRFLSYVTHLGRYTVGYTPSNAHREAYRGVHHLQRYTGRHIGWIPTIYTRGRHIGCIPTIYTPWEAYMEV